MAPKPKSATNIITGLTGLVTGTATVFAIHGWQAESNLKTLAVIGAAAVSMVAVELLIYRSHRNPSSGLEPAPINRLSISRIFQKLVGFWVTILALAGIYWLLPEYGDYYRPFEETFLLCLPILVAVSPIYIAYVDSRQVQPVDGYVELAKLLTGVRPESWDTLRIFARGWLVKGFFLPLMFVFLDGNLQSVWSKPQIPSLTNFDEVYEYCYAMLFMWDVMFAAIGYVLTLRLLDSHIRSVEPTVLGWVVCLACYPPFWALVSSNYFSYDQDQAYWGHFFYNIPALYVAWGIIILGLVTIYVWATVIFGIRFSNLTHRGIITNGPFRWVKHPAYLSKNITWWMISVPFLTTGSWTSALQSSLLLLGVNGIYLMRALTEERHLSKDPVYRDYQAFIAEHGLWAILKRRLRMGRRVPVTMPHPSLDGGK